MESLRHNVRGKERERERESERERERTHENLIQNNSTLYIECAQRALLYKSIQTDRSTDTYFNAHKWTSTLTPKFIPSRNICPTASQFPHRSGLLLHTGLAPGLRTGPTYPISLNRSGSRLISQQFSTPWQRDLNTWAIEYCWETRSTLARSVVQAENRIGWNRSVRTNRCVNRCTKWCATRSRSGAETTRPLERYSA